MKKFKDLTLDDFEKSPYSRWLYVLNAESLVLEIESNSHGKYRWALISNNVDLCSEYCYLTHLSALNDLKSRIQDIEECL